jgi:hypothetical protein
MRDLLIYLGVVLALWVAYMIRKHRRQRVKPRLGDADAYDGNLIIPATGEGYGPLTGHKSHRGDHLGHGSGHIGHGSGHAGHGSGHAGHGAGGGGHH